ncbi:tail protein [Vibrio phage Ceto]|uniref:Tail fiber protein n=1 Tax=Vibrio phage Ceto TaxID=2570300 RepID=A0A2H5BGF8_9CAUD|nr:tail protein [Vibrio phage Ceto]AUG85048.1 hypothetical protein CETO_41 [Vibrio phage Ceto]
MGIDGNEIYSKIDMILGTLANYIDFKKGTQQLVRIGDAGLDVVTGTLKEKGQRVYSPNNKPKLEDLSQPSTVVKPLKLTAGQWTTLLTNSDFKDGTGVYQILVTYSSYTNGGVAYTQGYTGQLYWFAQPTNASNVAEIPLHHMGHADGGEYIYLRTRINRGSKGDQSVDIKCNKSFASAVSFTARLVRIM